MLQSACRRFPGCTSSARQLIKGGIISFVVDGVHHLDIGTLLDLRGIALRTGHHCAQPTMRHFSITGTARASFFLYNTKDEVDRFIEALKESINLLKK